MVQQKRLHRTRLRRWVGTTMTVLVDAQRDFGSFTGRHAGQAYEVDGTTLVSADGLQVGDWAHVRVTGTRGYDLIAEQT
jgi:tRNA A37 methylthiotransferase MiaB